MKKLICAKDIDALVQKGETTLYVNAKTILTPSARDAALVAGVEIVEGQAPVAPATAASAVAAAVAPAGDPEITSDMIYAVLKSMLGKGMLKDLLDGMQDVPYVSESHENGLKLVRGNTVKMEKLDTGNPNDKVCYREMVGKGEAKLSAGFLEIENSRFDWELSYEEIDYVLEGSLTVEVDGKSFTANAGDMFFLPEGSKVVMGAEKARIFYATYPAL